MRELTPAPATALDSGTGEPFVGSFRGAIPRIELASLARNPFTRLVREKRWLYGALATEALYLGFAVIDLGYATSAFAYAFVRDGMKVTVDRSLKGPPFFGHVRQTAKLQYAARFDHPKGVVRMMRRRGERELNVDIRMEGLEVHAAMDCEAAPPSLTAVARVEGGILNTTEKRALMPVKGHALLGGKRHELDGALGGYDYTHGLLARHTAWRWAFLMGRAKGGELVAMNLVQGFVGEPECGLWVDGEVIPLAEGRFTFDASRPLDDWRVQTADGAVDLAFTPGGIHAEHTNLGVVASRFVQPVGLYSGTIRVPGRKEIVLEHVPGVTEDQDVLW